MFQEREGWGDIDRLAELQTQIREAAGLGVLVISDQ